MNPRILMVDHNPETLSVYFESLSGQFLIEAVQSGAEAVKRLEENGPYEVVMTAMDMPAMDGVELLAHCRRVAPDTTRIMLTSNTDQRTAVAAINKGHVFEFLNEPCEPEILKAAIDRGVQQYRLVTSERELLEKTLSGMVKIFTDIFSMLGLTRFRSSERAREYAAALGRELHIDQEWELEAAGLLSHIGCITMPLGLLQKIEFGAPLTVQERILVERSPEIGGKLLSNIPHLKKVARMIQYQRKNFDGTGLPDDLLAGEKIPLGARILRVALDFAELESEGMSKPTVHEQLGRRSGYYDPAILKAAYTSFVAPTVSAVSGRGRPITAANLKLGQVLAESIFNHDGVKIVGAGAMISPLLLEKLQNFAQLGDISEPIFVKAKPAVLPAA